MAKSEQFKYEALYARGDYGSANHGRSAYPIIKRLKIKSLLDVGCGDGQLVRWANDNGIHSMGVDFASGFGIRADATDIPVFDKIVDYVTAFDFLEHLLTHEIEPVLSEFARIARYGWIFSICYRQSISVGVNGELLHPTVRPEEWWIEKISKFADVTKDGIYLICKSKGDNE